MTKVGLRNPTLIYVDDPLRRLIDLEHLLCIEVPKHLVALRVTSEGVPLNFPVTE